MTSFRTPTKQKNYLCPHIAESVNIAENARYRQNFFAINFRRYLLPPAVLKLKNSIFEKNYKILIIIKYEISK